MAGYEEGFPWWKVALTAVVGIALAIGAAILAVKNNWFGLGAKANAQGGAASGGNGGKTEQVIDENKVAIFKPEMPLGEAKALADDKTKVLPDHSRNQLKLMLNFAESSGKKALGEISIPQGDGTTKNFKDIELLNSISIGTAGRFTFMNAVSLQQLRNIAVLPEEAGKYFPNMGPKEYAAFKQAVTDAKTDPNQVLSLTELTKVVTPMRPARKEDEKDKAAAQAKGAAVGASAAGAAPALPAAPSAPAGGAPAAAPAASAASR